MVNGYGLEVFNTTNPAAPAALGSGYQEAGGKLCSALAIDGNLAYLTAGDELQVLSIVDPANPSKEGSVALGDALYDVAARGPLAVVSGLMNAIITVDVTQSNAPALKGKLPGGSGFGAGR